MELALIIALGVIAGLVLGGTIGSAILDGEL